MGLDGMVIRDCIESKSTFGANKFTIRRATYEISVDSDFSHVSPPKESSY